MRILYVTAIGASARYFLTSHFATLRKQGHVLALACTADSDTHELAREYKIEFLPVTISTKISPFNDIKSVVKLRAYFKSFKPDVVHAHMSKAGCLAMMAARAANIRHRVYHNHGLSCLSASGLKRFLLIGIEKLSCRYATTVLFCSPSTKHEAIKYGICAPDKARVLGSGSISGIDTDRYHPAEASAALSHLRADIGLPPARYTVGFVGRLVAHKGLHTLLDAWEQLPKELYDNSVLLICGGYPTQELLERVNASCRTHANIIYAGSRSDMPDVYRLLDVLVLPSWYEGLPYSVLEAQSCGVPAIVTRVPGNIDAVIDNDTGLIITPHDSSALATALSTYLREDVMRGQQSENARLRIIEQFSESVVMGNLIAFYNELEDLRTD